MGTELDSLQLTLLDGKILRREAFDCGESTLNRYLKEPAGQDHKRNAATPYVLVDPDRPEEVVGYFTLSMIGVALEDLSADAKKLVPKYSDVPAVLIGRLAVAAEYQGRGYGGELLRRALRRCLDASQVAAAALVIVDALNADAAAFYGKFGFEPITSDDEYPKRLYMPLRLVAKAM